MQDYKELKPFLLDYVEEITNISPKNRHNYICPLCGSGSNKNGTGAFSILNNDFWQCFACGEYGDIVDLYAKHNKVSNAEAAQELAKTYLRSDYTPKQRTTPIKEKTENKNLTSFLLQAIENTRKPEYMEVLEYLHKRGLKNETIEKFKLGAYIDQHGAKRAVFPRSKYSALLRAITPTNGYDKTNKGPVELFNLAAFNSEENFIFVVEGEIDTLSFLQEGLPAVGLCSTSNADKLVDFLQRYPTDKKIYLAFDNDEAGAKATDKLKTALTGLNLDFEAVEIPKPYKDPNELYTADLGLFMATFDVRNKDLRALQEKAAGNTIDSFFKKAQETGLIIPTGLNGLDKVLHGGLSNELYTIGAMPSIGKSALMGWIADNISENGNPVIYYSLEMSELELQARSLSRISFVRGKLAKAKTADIILRHNSNFTDEEKDFIGECVAAYKEKAQNLYIITPQTPYLNEILTTCQHYKKVLGKSPVLIVDYLQLVDTDPKLKLNDTKTRMDYVVKTLKSLTLSENMPVILISSLNRAGYRGAVAMEDFKESGIIEFSSNVILGFYFTGIKNFKGDQESYNEQLKHLKQKAPREMAINILKNRSGESGGEILLNYYSKYNHFEETEQKQSSAIKPIFSEW